MSDTNNIPQTVGRTQAAAIIGVKPDTLKRWSMGRRGPVPAAKLGTQQQSRVLYAVEEIERWRADPAGYRWPTSSAASRHGRPKNERHR